MTSSEILEQLSIQADPIREFAGATFETLEDCWAIADTRLSAFSSSKMWAVIIEVVGFNAKTDEYGSRYHLFGNCLQEPESDYDYAEKRILTTPNSWNKEVEENQVWGIARDGFAFRWRGKRYDFAPTLDDLKEAGITLSTREIESGELTSPQMLRYVCEKLNHPFFLSEDALRDLLDKKSIEHEWKYAGDTERSWYENELGEFEEPPIPSIYLELILQTRDWIHPHVGSGYSEEDEWEISPEEAFATLAEVLATRDKTMWEQQDKTQFNSHWRHWAEIDADREIGAANILEDGKQKFRIYIKSLPPQDQREVLLALRENIDEAPSLLNAGSQMFLESDDKQIRLFRELSQQIDDLLAELDNN